MWSNGIIELRHGGVLERLRDMNDCSVHCVVTSPPYWGLRDYGLEPTVWGGGEHCEHEWGAVLISKANDSNRGTMDWQTGGDPGNKVKGERSPQGQFCLICSAWCGSLGLEPTPDLYVEHVVEIFREVRRVLRDDGSLWLNLGDTYAANRTYQITDNKHVDVGNNRPMAVVNGMKPKDLVGIPWSVAFALRADGWYLRSDIIWSKPNPMPESVEGRPTKAHEYLFLLTKSKSYYYDADAIREPAEWAHWGEQTEPKYGGSDSASGWIGQRGKGKETLIDSGRNKRTVWEIATQPYPEAHFATFPEKLIEPCILAGTSEWGVCPKCGAPWQRIVDSEPMEINRSSRKDEMGEFGRTQSSGTMTKPASRTTQGWKKGCRHMEDPVPATVLDPFIGSGTTAVVAQKLGRRCIGIDAKGEYLELAQKRIEAIPLPLPL